MLFNVTLVSHEIRFSFGTCIWVTFTSVKSSRVPQGKGETWSEYILRKCTQKLGSLWISLFWEILIVVGMFSLNRWSWRRRPETLVQLLCSKQDQLQQVAHLWSGLWLSPRMEAPQCLWAACCSVCPPPRKMFSYVWMEFPSIRFGPTAQYPATCYWILLRRNWLHLLIPSHQVFIFISPPCPNSPTTFPQPLPSPDWTTTIFSGSLYQSDAAKPCHLCGLCWICSCVSLSPVLGSSAVSTEPQMCAVNRIS